MGAIYFAGTYPPIMCGIASYTSYLTCQSHDDGWGVLSFDLKKYGDPLVDEPAATEKVSYKIPGRKGYTAQSIMEGLKELGAKVGESVLWFQHEFGIWSNDDRFISTLKEINFHKIVTFHTIHFQSTQTSTGLTKIEIELLRGLLPNVDAVTVFSRGAYYAVTDAFPLYKDKVYILRHGIHSYPEIRLLSRKKAKEKLNDFLINESNLDQEAKDSLRKQRVLIDENALVVGQTGYMAPEKNSDSLFAIRDELQKLIPGKNVVVIRVGAPREERQKLYVKKLYGMQNGINKFLLPIFLPGNMFPMAQRAFDINFYWPTDCTQSGVMSHALGAGALIASRDMEGVGENLRDAGELVDSDLSSLLQKMKEVVYNSNIEEEIEKAALNYAEENSWGNQMRRHYELAERVLTTSLIR